MKKNNLKVSLHLLQAFLVSISYLLPCFIYEVKRRINRKTDIVHTVTARIAGGVIAPRFV